MQISEKAKVKENKIACYTHAYMYACMGGVSATFATYTIRSLLAACLL